MSIESVLRAGQQKFLQEAVEERIRARQQIPQDALLWMAVAPSWTVPLAGAAGFPAGPDGVEAVFDKMEEQDICRVSEPTFEAVFDAETNRSHMIRSDRKYAMVSEVVRAVTGEVKQDPNRGPRDLQTVIARVGSAMLRAKRKASLAPALDRWAQLASKAEKSWELTNILDAEISKALKTEEITAAIGWVEAALQLEPLLTDQLSELLRLVSLRVKLKQRWVDNKRLLGQYLEREEQTQAFEDLLAGDDKEWALHFAGAGGVGKTMLMRGLQARTAPKRGASIARVDFDYLNPEYPSTKPALLLLQLAEELRLHDTVGRASSYFQSFSSKAVTFHEGLLGERAALLPPLQLIQDVEFQLLLDTFANALRELPQPVVVILDTCEELEKMLPSGQTPAGVAATFEIFENLHRRFSKLRLVLSGRRPLASRGAGGWSAVGSHGAAREARPYLRLHEVLDFTRHDAERYLRELAGCPEALIPAILERAERTPGVSPFQCPGQQRHAAELRYRPYELSIYGTWARESPELTSDVIRATDSDKYVKIRIVERIKNAAIARLLPAIAWLGRFDLPTIAALARLMPDSSQARELFDEISRQEWIDGRDPQFSEIDRGLRPRLLGYFLSADPARAEQARRDCAIYLEHLFSTASLSKLDTSHFEAMLRVTAADAARAVSWWTGIEKRVVEQSAYGWILPVTTRLLAEENWTGTAGSNVQAAILATHASALIHDDYPDGLDEVWARVEQALDRFPEGSAKRQLKLRASVARLESLELDAARADEQLAGTLLGAIERRLDRTQDGFGKVPLDAFIPIAPAFQTANLSSEVRAFACCLCARAAARFGRREEALALFQAGLGLREKLPSLTKQRWLDWRSPSDFRSCVGLAFLDWADPANLSPEECLRWFQPNITDGGTSEGLTAALLTVAAARSPLKGMEQLLLEWSGRINAESARPRFGPKRTPLSVVAAEQLARLGLVGEAVKSLNLGSRDLEGVSTAYGEMLEAERAYTRIIRRFRLLEERHHIPDSIANSDELEDEALAWRTSAFGLPEHFRGERVFHDDHWLKTWQSKHVCWSGLPTPSDDMREGIVGWGTLAFAGIEEAPDDSFTVASCRFDVLELNVIAHLAGLPTTLPIRVPDTTAWWREHPSQPIEALTLWLRAWALGAAPPPDEALYERVGLARAADIAFEEGELLALRLPHGIKLLTVARDLRRRCKEPLGSWIAAVCALTALVRYGELPQAGATDALRADCPSEIWQQIDRLVEENTPIDNEWLRAWMFRHAACVALHRDTEAPAGRLERLFGSRTRSGGWPMEIAAWFQGEFKERLERIRRAQFTVSVPAAAPSIEHEGVRGPIAGKTLQVLGIRSRRSGSIFEQARLEVRGTLNGEESRLTLKTPDAQLPYDVMVGEVRKQLPPRWLDTVDRLIVNPASAWICWEAIFSKLRTRSSVIGPEEPEEMVRRPAWNPNELNVSMLTSDHEGVDLGAAWRLGQFTYAHDLDAFTERISPRGEHIVHVIADAIETRSGVRLRLGDLADAPRTERGPLVRPHDLVKALPNVVLCVIQAPLGTDLRTGVDRERAAILRTFAAELHEAEVPNVITLPSLEFNTARGVVIELRAAMKTASPQALHDAAISVRRDLASSARSDDAREGSLDICCYAR